MQSKLIIFGDQEVATLARFYFEQDGGRKPEAFVVDDAYVRESMLEGLPVIAWSEALKRFPPPEAELFVAIAYSGLNAVRKVKFEACRAAGYRMASYISTKSIVWPDLIHGQNCFILENNTLQPTVRIGDNVTIWCGNEIGHAAVIRDHAYLSSQVALAGHCEIGERCFLSVGARVKDGCKIGAESFITMGAVVTRNLPERSVVLGPKSQVADAETADFIRRSYFPSADNES